MTARDQTKVLKKEDKGGAKYTGVLISS